MNELSVMQQSHLIEGPSGLFGRDEVSKMDAAPVDGDTSLPALMTLVPGYTPVARSVVGLSALVALVLGSSRQSQVGQAVVESIPVCMVDLEAIRDCSFMGLPYGNVHQDNLVSVSGRFIALGVEGVSALTSVPFPCREPIIVKVIDQGGVSLSQGDLSHSDILSQEDMNYVNH